jgi:hypothetical protein
MWSFDQALSTRTARHLELDYNAVASLDHINGGGGDGGVLVNRVTGIGWTLDRTQSDLYPRFSPTMEWDTAAGHAILLAAGGGLCNPDGSDFLYGLKQHNWLNGSFIAFGDAGLRPSR